MKLRSGNNKRPWGLSSRDRNSSQINKMKRLDETFIDEKICHEHCPKNEEENNDVEFYDQYQLILNLPPAPDVQIPVLPAKSLNCLKNYTLVLDMDETLIHSHDLKDDNNKITCWSENDFVFDINVPNSKSVQKLLVKKRPHLDYFLAQVSKDWDVVVFTASHRCYARAVLDHLDPSQTLIHHRIYRGECYVIDGKFIKNLKILGRDLNQTLIVDNCVESFGFQLDNGILIKSWYDDPDDDHLLKILKILREIQQKQVDNIPTFLRNKFKISEKILALSSANNNQL